MKILELVEAVQAERPGVLGEMPPKRAAALVKEVLSNIRTRLSASDAREVKVQGFGRFVIKRPSLVAAKPEGVADDKRGAVTAGAGPTVKGPRPRRIVFRPAAVKGAKAGGKAGAKTLDKAGRVAARAARKAARAAKGKPTAPTISAAASPIPAAAPAKGGVAPAKVSSAPKK